MLALTLGLLTTIAADPQAGGYPREDLLIEAVELAKPEVGKQYRILDARGRPRYNEGHIPGAFWLNSLGWMRNFEDGKDVADWNKRIGELGLSPDMPIVIYDDQSSKDAARMWWILRYWGFRDVKLLNGGWPAWQAISGAVAKEETKPTGRETKLEAHAERLADKAQLLDWIKGKPPQIVDARTEGEFCGETKAEKRNGAIPGATHLDWVNLVDKKTQRFKTAEDLAKIFKEAGIDPAKPTVTYCQSGGRASVMAFALELMGGKEVRNYYRSWGEWGSSEDTPIIIPKVKK